MFSLARSPLCFLLVAIIALAATTSIASAFMPPDLSAKVQTTIPPAASPIAQHLSGPQHSAAAIDKSPAKPKSTCKRPPAVRSRRPRQAQPLRSATAQSKKLANLMPDLREPPTQQPIATSGLEPLVDLRAALERMDDLAQFYRNRNQMSELEAALKQRVQLSLRIAELDTIARREGGEAAMVAFLGTGTSSHQSVRHELNETERQYTKTQSEIGDIDAQITQLQRRRAVLDKQLAELGERRSALRTQLDGTPIASPAVDPALAGNNTDDATGEAERLADAIGETDAMLKNGNLSQAERQTMEQRRADMAKQLAAAVMRACQIPSSDTMLTVADTAQRTPSSASIVGDLRSTVRELKTEVTRLSDELLHAQQNLVSRFDEIQRRTNVIEAEIRTRMGMRVNAAAGLHRRTNHAGEHTALGSEND